MPYSDYAIAQDIPALVDDLSHLVSTMVAEGVPERFITPIRCLVLHGRTLAVAHGVTPEDCALFVAHCRVEIQHLDDAITAVSCLEVADVAATA